MKSLLIIIFCVLPIWSKPKGSRIIGGYEAFAGQFPYAAAVYKNTADGNYFCTGTIVSNDWVLTAGQCVDGAILFTLLVGTRTLTGDEGTTQRLATDYYVLHPDYNPFTLENDVGLIKFRLPIQFDNYVKSLPLPHVEYSFSGGRTYGWGQLSDGDATLSNTLNYVSLARISDDECRKIYGDQLKQNMGCFGGSYNQGTCLGDSGSPVLGDVVTGVTIITAIASFFSSNGCESTDPSGYTRIYPYMDWLDSVMNA